jgi:hypothetical protein
MLGEWSDGLKYDKETRTARLLLVLAAGLFMSPVEMSLSDSGIDGKVIVH